MASTKLTGELERRCAAGVQMAAAELAAPDPEGICATFGEWRQQSRRRPWTWLPGLCYEALEPLGVAFPENDEAVVIAGRVLIGVESNAEDVRRVWPRWQAAPNETGELDLAKGAPSQLHRRRLLSAVDSFWGKLADNARDIGQAVAAGQRDAADQMVRDSRRQLDEIVERIESAVDQLSLAEQEEAEREEAEQVGDALDVWPIDIVEPSAEPTEEAEPQLIDEIVEPEAEPEGRIGGVFDAEQFLTMPLPDDLRQEVLWAPRADAEPEGAELAEDELLQEQPVDDEWAGEFVTEPQEAESLEDLEDDEQVTGDRPVEETQGLAVQPEDVQPEDVQPEVEATQALEAQLEDPEVEATQALEAQRGDEQPAADETTALDEIAADETTAPEEAAIEDEPERDEMWDLDELPPPDEYAELERLNDDHPDDGADDAAAFSDTEAAVDAEDEAVAVDPEDVPRSDASRSGKHAQPVDVDPVLEDTEAWSVADLADDDDELADLPWDDEFDPAALVGRTEELRQATAPTDEPQTIDLPGDDIDSEELVDDVRAEDELLDEEIDAPAAPTAADDPIRDLEGRIVPGRRARREAVAAAQATESTGELPAVDDTDMPEDERADEEPLVGAGAVAARTEAQNNTNILIFLGAITLGALLWFAILATGLVS